MRSLNIGIFGNDLGLMEKLARSLGKKGSVTDITFYNCRSGDTNLTAIFSHTYPEKVQTLFYVISLSEVPILVIGSIDKVLGEIIISLDQAGYKKGFILLRGEHLRSQVEGIIENTKLKSFRVLSGENSLNELRIKILEMVQGNKDIGKPYVIVDNSFVVKSVGTVVLGVLKDGIIKVHDKLRVHPFGIYVTIKSIQKHDKDFKEAYPGDRVGLGLKDVRVDDVPRGSILSNFATDFKKVKIELIQNKFYKEGIKEGQTLFLSIGLQYIPFKVEKFSGSTLEIEAEKMFTRAGEMKMFVLNPNSRSLRVVGTARVIE